MQIIDTKYSLLLPINRDNFIKYCKEFDVAISNPSSTKNFALIYKGIGVLIARFVSSVVFSTSKSKFIKNSEIELYLKESARIKETMSNKEELVITPPEGYSIDLEKSNLALGVIKFKSNELKVRNYQDIIDQRLLINSNCYKVDINGVIIKESIYYNNKTNVINLFRSYNRKYLASAIALIKLGNVLSHYKDVANNQYMDDIRNKISRDLFSIKCNGKELWVEFENTFTGLNLPFLFTGLESAKDFLKYNKDDLETYFMIK